jgi:hypothetical protein
MECEGRLDGQRKSTYGFKAHTNVDEDGLIKSTDYTPGNVLDSNCFTPLLDGGLASMYKFGQGAPENQKTAEKWFTLASEQGHANAQDNLGAVYEYRGGLFTDYRRAYMWYNLSSYNGSEKGW